MLVFLDCEVAGLESRDQRLELISLAMVTEDGRNELYLEVQDFSRDLCSDFVRKTVWGQLGQYSESVVKRIEVGARIRSWFDALPRSVIIACDSNLDKDVLLSAVGALKPENLTGWKDLRPLIDSGVYHRAVEDAHDAGCPWHHALFDARAHRAGWLAWMDSQKAGVRPADVRHRRMR